MMMAPATRLHSSAGTTPISHRVALSQNKRGAHGHEEKKADKHTNEHHEHRAPDDALARGWRQDDNGRRRHRSGSLLAPGESPLQRLT